VTFLYYMLICFTKKMLVDILFLIFGSSFFKHVGRKNQVFLNSDVSC
jgi:hypothetical protein